MMKKLLLAVSLLFVMFLVACGPPDQNASSGGGSGGSGGADTQAPAETPTRVVLATPTSKPIPPTPTPRPTPTPAPIVSAEEEEVVEAGGETEGQEGGDVVATEEVAPEPEPEVATGPLYDDMVLIPAGSFTMGYDGGKPKNAPAHTVELPDYEIDRFEVTTEEFAWFVEQTGYVTYAEENNSARTWRSNAEDRASHPVIYVTWDDAFAYCEWAGKRLPTEAEWEKAARGDDGRIYPWGNDFVAENANVKESGIRATTAVGSYPAGASPYGIEDMVGNVSEWTASPALPYEGQSIDADSRFFQEGQVHRGGNWFDAEDENLANTYNRNAGLPDVPYYSDVTGFRCVRDVQ